MGAAKLGDTETVTQHGQGRRAKTLSRALVADSEAALHTPTKTQHKTVEKRENGQRHSQRPSRKNTTAPLWPKNRTHKHRNPYLGTREREIYSSAPVDNTSHTHSQTRL